MHVHYTFGHTHPPYPLLSLLPFPISLRSCLKCVFFSKLIRIYMQEKMCIYLSEYILLHLTWWSPVPFTFLKITYLGLQVLGPGQAPKATLINPVSYIYICNSITYVYLIFFLCSIAGERLG